MPKRKIEELENGNIRITVPLIFRTMANRRKIVVPDSEPNSSDPFIVAIACGRRWQALIDEGRFPNVRELAKSIGRESSVNARLKSRNRDKSTVRMPSSKSPAEPK